MDDQEDYVIIWEPPVLEKPEFRLYYDDRGNVITYTCEKLDGNYIIIDALTFAEARPDVKVVDNKLVKIGTGSVISRLFSSDEGIMCEKEDISIVTNSDGCFYKLRVVKV
jgi:hypothetical protein